MSELIQRSFPDEFLNKKTGKPSKYSSLEQRMRSFNILASLLAQKDLLDPSILYKSLFLLIQSYEESNQSYNRKNK